VIEQKKMFSIICPSPSFGWVPYQHFIEAFCCSKASEAAGQRPTQGCSSSGCGAEGQVLLWLTDPTLAIAAATSCLWLALLASETAGYSLWDDATSYKGVEGSLILWCAKHLDMKQHQRAKLPSTSQQRSLGSYSPTVALMHRVCCHTATA